MGKLVGHERVVAFLERTVRDGRPAHAYLFTGREGVGKRTAAIRFACMLNCPDTRADPDLDCRVCRRIVAGNHPDFLMESPERGIIRIDRIRNLQGFFRYAPAEARYRVMVLDDAHTMNQPAQNALLKTLEEPPAGRLLILVTSKPHVLLPTVRSRCRRVHFGPIPMGDLVELLEQERGMDSQKARALAAMGFGSISRAKEINSAGFLDLREKVLSYLDNPGGAGLAGLLELSGTLAADKKKANDAIDIARSRIRDVVMAKAGCEAWEPIHGDSLDTMDSAAQHLNVEDLLQVYDELNRAADLIEAEINVNRNLVMDVMLIRITRILAGPNLGIA